MIVGVGVDMVGVERLQALAGASGELLDRVFDASELVDATGKRLSWQSLAARFAAKEAAAKALGVPEGSDWHDFVVTTGERGRPGISLRGRSAEAAREQGVVRWHLSLTHEAGFAVAYAVAEGLASPPVE